MIDERSKLLIATIKKLYHRGAKHNIQKILVKTHEADLAALLEGFEPGERYDLFKMEPSLEKRAGVLSRLAESLQMEMLSCMSQDEILQLVNLMDSDDAADLLGRLPNEDSSEILAAMERKDSDDVADLMGYPEDSSGGLMSSDFLALDKNLTVGDAIQRIQDEEDDIGSAFYVYVVNDDNKLVGVVSLKQLLLSRKNESLKSLMFTEVISVTVDTDQEDAAKTVEHYDFLSIPVVDHSNHLVGVITVDDIIDVIREEAEEDLLAMGQANLGFEASIWERLKARLGWLVFSFIGGLTSFYIVYTLTGYLGAQDSRIRIIASFIPLFLSIGATTGSQAATVAVGAIRTGRFDMTKLRRHIWIEFKMSLIFCVIFGSLIWMIAQMISFDFQYQNILVTAMSLQIILSILLGNFIPVFLSRIGIDPTAGAVPILAALADVLAMAILSISFLWM